MTAFIIKHSDQGGSGPPSRGDLGPDLHRPGYNVFIFTMWFLQVVRTLPCT